MKNKAEPKVTVSWRPLIGEPSAAYRRLVHLLFKKRGKPAGTLEDADSEELNERNRPRNSKK